MKSFRTSNTLENGHSVSTDSTGIAIMKRTSKVKRVSVNVFKLLFHVILLDAFRMIVFSTISS